MVRGKSEAKLKSMLTSTPTGSIGTGKENRTTQKLRLKIFFNTCNVFLVSDVWV